MNALAAVASAGAPWAAGEAEEKEAELVDPVLAAPALPAIDGSDAAAATLIDGNGDVSCEGQGELRVGSVVPGRLPLASSLAAYITHKCALAARQVPAQVTSLPV